MVGVTPSWAPRAMTSAGACEPTNNPRPETEATTGCATAAGARGLAFTGAGAFFTTMRLAMCCGGGVVVGAGIVVGATVVVGAGTVVGDTGGWVTLVERALLNLMVGWVAAVRGAPPRSTAKVTMMATPSMATTNSFGIPAKRANPDPRM